MRNRWKSAPADKRGSGKVKAVEKRKRLKPAPAGKWESGEAAISESEVRRRKMWGVTKIVFATVIAASFAILFLMPIVLTITNSFMASSEISANYGSVFATNDSGGKVYISEKVNLKFIPDMVSVSQYTTVLLKSPEYLLKFWNSVILVVQIGRAHV